MLQTISIIVSGKVQGVYYRQSAKETAQQLNITGEVKNLKDGTVELTATGSKEQLDLLIEWCKHGPSRAIVKKILVQTIELKTFKDFSIVRI